MRWSKNINIENEAERLYFSCNKGILELNYCRRREDIEFHKKNIVIKLKGSEKINYNHNNSLKLVNIELKENLVVFSPKFIYQEYLTEQKGIQDEKKFEMLSELEGQTEICFKLGELRLRAQSNSINNNFYLPKYSIN